MWQIFTLYFVDLYSYCLSFFYFHSLWNPAAEEDLILFILNFCRVPGEEIDELVHYGPRESKVCFYLVT